MLDDDRNTTSARYHGGRQVAINRGHLKTQNYGCLNGLLNRA